MQVSMKERKIERSSRSSKTKASAIKSPTMSDVKNVEDKIRELINLVAIFKNEYELPKEVESTLSKKLRSLAKSVGNIKCK